MNTAQDFRESQKRIKKGFLLLNCGIIHFEKSKKSLNCVGSVRNDFNSIFLEDTKVTLFVLLSEVQTIHTCHR